jgi:hypothetical protein
MIPRPGSCANGSRWRFRFPDGELNADACERLRACAMEAVSGARGEPLRRSRHATTYRIRMDGGLSDSGADTVFLKVLDPPSGAAALLKWVWRGPVARHLVRIVAKLRQDGVEVPRVLMIGYDRASGRELVAFEGIAGRMVPYYMDRRSNTPSATRRAVLGALGREVARLHRLGYVHGDLTPYNVIVTSVSPPRFAFIDHERTRRRSLFAVNRHRMRNLVQLGRFDIRGLSRSDRVRVLVAYAGEMGIDRRRTLRTAARMLQARLARDRARNSGGSRDSACAMAGQGRVGGS